MHTLVGAGSSGRGLSAGSGLDVANLLKPPLARGELQCIGATTLDEFRKYFERDAALERRFQPVHIGEASPEQALAILGSLQVRRVGLAGILGTNLGIGFAKHRTSTCPPKKHSFAGRRL